jgi:hypothetical protein
MEEKTNNTEALVMPIENRNIFTLANVNIAQTFVALTSTQSNSYTFQQTQKSFTTSSSASFSAYEEERRDAFNTWVLLKYNFRRGVTQIALEDGKIVTITEFDTETQTQRYSITKWGTDKEQVAGKSPDISATNFLFNTFGSIVNFAPLLTVPRVADTPATTIVNSSDSKARSKTYETLSQINSKTTTRVTSLSTKFLPTFSTMGSIKKCNLKYSLLSTCLFGKETCPENQTIKISYLNDKELENIRIFFSNLETNYENAVWVEFAPPKLGGGRFNTFKIRRLGRDTNINITGHSIKSYGHTTIIVNGAFKTRGQTDQTPLPPLNTLDVLLNPAVAGKSAPQRSSLGPDVMNNFKKTVTIYYRPDRNSLNIKTETRLLLNYSFNKNRFNLKTELKKISASISANINLDLKQVWITDYSHYFENLLSNSQIDNTNFNFISRVLKTYTSKRLLQQYNSILGTILTLSSTEGKEDVNSTYAATVANGGNGAGNRTVLAVNNDNRPLDFRFYEYLGEGADGNVIGLPFSPFRKDFIIGYVGISNQGRIYEYVDEFTINPNIEVPNQNYFPYIKPGIKTIRPYSGQFTMTSQNSVITGTMNIQNQNISLNWIGKDGKINASRTQFKFGGNKFVNTVSPQLRVENIAANRRIGVFGRGFDYAGNLGSYNNITPTFAGGCNDDDNLTHIAQLLPGAYYDLINRKDITINNYSFKTYNRVDVSTNNLFRRLFVFDSLGKYGVGRGDNFIIYNSNEKMLYGAAYESVLDIHPMVWERGVAGFGGGFGGGRDPEDCVE